MKRVSIKDVAREAGVSATTVSYVLNRNPDETISAETTQRVLEAVRLIMEAAAGAHERMECILPLTLVERDSVMERRGR